jgi:hypothetical protein
VSGLILIRKMFLESRPTQAAEEVCDLEKCALRLDSEEGGLEEKETIQPHDVEEGPSDHGCGQRAVPPRHAVESPNHQEEIYANAQL